MKMYEFQYTYHIYNMCIRCPPVTSNNILNISIAIILVLFSNLSKYAFSVAFPNRNGTTLGHILKFEYLS